MKWVTFADRLPQKLTPSLVMRFKTGHTIITWQMFDYISKDSLVFTDENDDQWHTSLEVVEWLEEPKLEV